MPEHPLDLYGAEVARRHALRRFTGRPGDTASPGEPQGLLVPDQVPRLDAYRRAHPDAEFREPCVHDPMWTAVLDDGRLEVRAFDLAPLMDELEWRDRPPA